MLVERIRVPDVYGKQIDIAVEDIISYKKCGNDIDLWVKDKSMEQGKRLYILPHNIQSFERILKSAPIAVN